MVIIFHLDFFSCQMGDAGTLLVYNKAGVHNYLMKPWVSCALTQNCISPIGAQDTGCRLVHFFLLFLQEICCLYIFFLIFFPFHSLVV